MRTLIIDTSGAYSTVALTRDDQLLGHLCMHAQPLTHLHLQIQSLCASLIGGVGALERVAIVTGPGTWTGLNIGVAAGKTLAQVLELPVVVLSTLDALVAARRWRGGPVYALLDAKRGQVYRGRYPTDAQGVVQVAAGDVETVPLDQVHAALAGDSGPPLVIEYGRVHAAALAAATPGLCLVNDSWLGPEGLLRALLARPARALTGDDLLRLMPNYMQKPSAERNAGNPAQS